MIRELKYVGHNLTFEQLVQVVIRCLCNSQEHIRVNMMHNNIKTFDDIQHHLDLESKCFKAVKGFGE